MEERFSEDLGEEIISRLRELIEILERKFGGIENGKEFPSAHCSRD